eukprot:gene554-301_t
MRKRKHPLHFVSPRSQVQSSQLLFCQGAGGMGALWVRRHFLKAPRSKWIILFYGFFARLQMASSGQVRGLQLGGGARGRGGSVEQVGPRQPQHQSGSQKAACPHQWLLRFFNSLAHVAPSIGKSVARSLFVGSCVSFCEHPHDAERARAPVSVVGSGTALRQLSSLFTFFRTMFFKSCRRKKGEIPKARIMRSRNPVLYDRERKINIKTKEPTRVAADTFVLLHTNTGYRNPGRDPSAVKYPDNHETEAKATDRGDHITGAENEKVPYAPAHAQSNCCAFRIPPAQNIIQVILDTLMPTWLFLTVPWRWNFHFLGETEIHGVACLSYGHATRSKEKANEEEKASIAFRFSPLPGSSIEPCRRLFCQGAGGMGALWVRRHFLKAPRSKWIILFYGFFARLQMASSGQVRGLQLGGGARDEGASRTSRTPTASAPVRLSKGGLPSPVALALLQLSGSIVLLHPSERVSLGLCLSAPVSRSVSVNRTAHQTRTMRSGHEHRYRLWGAGLPSDSSPSLP